MKTILIIDKETIEMDSLVGMFKKWQTEINILTVREEQAAINIIAAQQVDLVVCDLSLTEKEKPEGLACLTHTFPYIPCIAIIPKGSGQTVEVIALGASYCLERPFEAEQLLQYAGELLEIGNFGTVKGIPVHSLLQMLEGEEKTCTLMVHHGKEGTGLLYMQNGVVISAEAGDQKNEDAVYEILIWEETIAEIKYFNSQRQREIHKPLLSLIMEAFRRKDERDHFEQKQQSEHSPRRQLKHVSTVGNRIPLDIGSQIKMEFSNIDIPLMSSMVGMLTDKHLIVTTPTSFSIVKETLKSNSRITIKYIHQGRLCMFKTTLLKAIDDPHPLLYLDYPLAIHYYELRRAKRIATIIPCTSHLPRGVEFSGVLVDISSYGGQIQLKNKENQPLPNIEIDSRIQLRCLLPGFKEEQEINGLVKNIRKSSMETRIGLEFMSLNESLKESIERYISSVENIAN